MSKKLDLLAWKGRADHHHHRLPIFGLSPGPQTLSWSGLDVRGQKRESDRTSKSNSLDLVIQA